MKKVLLISAVVILGLTTLIVAYLLFSKTEKLRLFTESLEQAQSNNVKYGELSTEFTNSYNKQNELRISLQPAIEKNQQILKQIVQTIEQQQKVNDLQQEEITKNKSIIPELKKKLTNLPSENQSAASQVLTNLEQTNNQKELVYQQNKLILEQEYIYFLQLSQGKLNAKEASSNEYQKLNQLIDQLNRQLKDYEKSYQRFYDQIQ